MKKIHSFDDVFDSQKVFRLVLTAMYSPAKTVNIKAFSDKLYGETPELLALAMTLLDNEVSFDTCGNNKLADEIVSLTLAKKETVENADYIFVTDENMLQAAIGDARCGTLRDPHKSATIIIKTEFRQDTVLFLEGPGINGTAEFKTSPVVKAALDIRDNNYYEYPQGVDFIFISEKGELFAIPRLILRRDK